VGRVVLACLLLLRECLQIGKRLETRAGVHCAKEFVVSTAKYGGY
jgi:hypothetical protein